MKNIYIFKYAHPFKLFKTKCYGMSFLKGFEEFREYII